MLMIHHAPTSPPRLAALPPPAIAQFPPPRRAPLTLLLIEQPTPSILPARHPYPLFITPYTPRATALVAAHRSNPRRQHSPAVLARTRGMPAQRQEASQPMSLHRLRRRLLQPDAQVAQELGVPRIRVGGKQFVRLLEGEQVEHELPDLGALVDLIV